MLLEILIATVAILSWPLIFALYYHHEVKTFLSQRFSWRQEKPTKSDLPPLSLPMRYDHAGKKTVEAEEETPPVPIIREGQEDTMNGKAE
ncbi:hypothetical protein CGLAMM_01440 [Acetobacteraceae bacterium EV16G]|uniref:Uncharacterized protein n=1 Tax=Sorlinia euscelidii TaxID=3081148 RepID=A0ABU7U4G7_9PROT